MSLSLSRRGADCFMVTTILWLRRPNCEGKLRKSASDNTLHEDER